MKLSIYIFLSFLLVSVGISCKKDFLKLVPQGQQVAVTTNDYSLLMNSASLYLYDPAGGWAAAALMGDDVAAEAIFFNSAQSQSQQAFKWGNDLYLPSQPAFDLRRWLSNLYAVNKVINEVMESASGTEQLKKAIQGEALATRAWLYFQFVNYYGKPYLASSASSDPGFPIVKAADINLNGFERNTVQENYDFITSDLTTAIVNLPLVNTAGRTRWSKPAAEAMLGKVYLFMGRSDLALPLLNASLNDNAALTNPARLYDYNKEFAADGKFLPITANGPSNSPETNYNDLTESMVAYTFFNGPYNGNGFGTDFIVLSPQAFALFGASDLRLKFFTPNFAYGQPNPSGRLSKFQSYQTPYSKYGVELPELYLLIAECKARLNDLAGAKIDLETLRKSRMPATDAETPAAAMASQAALVRFIFDEREREFATDGYRWFDMRRMSVDPFFPSQTFTHILYNNSSNTNTTIYTLDISRLTLRLPPEIMIANPQIQNNP